jgi:hypothetical protein
MIRMHEKQRLHHCSDACVFIRTPVLQNALQYPCVHVQYPFWIGAIPATVRGQSMSTHDGRIPTNQPVPLQTACADGRAC